MILLGSRALAFRLGDGFWRKPIDFDFLGNQIEFDQWLEKNKEKIKPTELYKIPEFNKWIVKSEHNPPIEFEIVKPGTSNEMLIDLVSNDPETMETKDFGLIPSLNAIFAIKDSHKYKKFNTDSQSFWKHTIDWHQMKRMNIDIKTEYKEFHSLREKETYALQKHPKLNSDKESFFKDDGIQYVYDHDSIHCSVAPNGIPAYTFYSKDDQPVFSDKNKFFSQPREIQLAGVIQEAAVLAIERSKIPFGDTWSDKQAWLFSLSKICTSITSGWFREFAYENIFDVIRLYPENYWIKFQQDIKNGLVKNYIKN